MLRGTDHEQKVLRNIKLNTPPNESLPLDPPAYSHTRCEVGVQGTWLRKHETGLLRI